MDARQIARNAEPGVLRSSAENQQSQDGPQFPPLAQETRSHVPTDCAAHHLNRRPQTMRTWACTEAGALRPIRVHGRLLWPVAGLKALLGLEQSK